MAKSKLRKGTGIARAVGAPIFLIGEISGGLAKTTRELTGMKRRK